MQKNRPDLARLHAKWSVLLQFLGKSCMFLLIWPKIAAIGLHFAGKVERSETFDAKSEAIVAILGWMRGGMGDY